MPASRVNTIALAIFACLLWSTAFVGIKIGLQYTTPLRFAGIRFAIAGLLVLPLAGNPVESLRQVGRHFGYVLQVAVLYTTLLYGFFYTGLSLGSASTTAIVVGGGPLFIALMAHFMMPNDRLTLQKTVAFLIGMAGIVTIAVSRYHFEWDEGQAFIGVLFLVAANVSGGFGNILIAKSRQAISPLLLSAAQLFVGGLILFVVSLFVESEPEAAKPLAYFGALAYLSVLSAAAMTIWFVLLRRPGIKVSKLNIWKFLIPVFGAVLSWWLLENDHPDPTSLVGMALIAASLVLINLPPRSTAVGDKLE